MRLFSLLMVITFSLGLSVSAETLTLWNGHSLEHLKPELDRFTQQTGHTVVQQHFRADRFRDQVLSSVLLPDLYFIPSDQISNQQEYELAAWPAAIAAEFGLRSDGYLEGQWYGLPISMGNQLVMYYRRDLVKPLASLEAIPDKQLAWPRDQAFWFMPFLTAQGGWPLADGKFTLNTPQMAKALAVYQQAVARFPASDCELLCNEQAFIKGEVSYLIDGDWAYQMLHEVLGEKLGVAVLPTLQGRPMQPLSSSYVLAVRAGISPAKRQAAVELGRFLLSDQSQRSLYLRSKLFPSVNRVAKAMAASMTDDMKTLHRQLELSRAMPNERKMLVVWLVMGKALKLFLAGEYNAQEAAHMMQSLAEEEGFEQ